MGHADLDARQMPYRILVVDDDNLVRKYVAKGFERARFAVETASSGRSAIAMLREQSFDGIVCDLRMPDGNGLDVLEFVQGLSEAPAFIVLSAYGTVRTAVEAVQRGADDFLEKPIEIDALLRKVRSLVEARRRRRGEVVADDGLVGSARWLDEFRARLNRLAQSDAALLVEGETGTGKSLVTQAVWRASYRADGPFVVVDCAALRDQPIERELFGELEQGSQGAATPGKLSEAAGGVLVLDAVDALQPEQQWGLLQLLQARRYQPVGSDQTQVADVRFIATTNRKLWREVRAGRFRSDLFFRLNVLRLEIPPLRERPWDIPLLVEHFQEQFEPKLSRSTRYFTKGAVEALSEYPWPGNVRQLRGIVEQLLLTAERDAITEREVRAELMRVPSTETDPLPDLVSDAVVSGEFLSVEANSLAEAVAHFERQLILNALSEAGGNQTKAARLLNVSRTTLIDKMKRLGLRSG